jgi:hypothetical protein
VSQRPHRERESLVSERERERESLCLCLSQGTGEGMRERVCVEWGSVSVCVPVHPLMHHVTLFLEV